MIRELDSRDFEDIIKQNDQLRERIGQLERVILGKNMMISKEIEKLEKIIHEGLAQLTKKIINNYE